MTNIIITTITTTTATKAKQTPSNKDLLEVEI
jgi:hypothetical protein